MWYGILSVEWIKEHKVHCSNSEINDVQLKTLEECKRLCVGDCTGVSFSTSLVVETGTSHCYFCKDDITNSSPRYDVYQKQGRKILKMSQTWTILLLLSIIIIIIIIVIIIISGDWSDVGSDSGSGQGSEEGSTEGSGDGSVEASGNNSNEGSGNEAGEGSDSGNVNMNSPIVLITICFCGTFCTYLFHEWYDYLVIG